MVRVSGKPSRKFVRRHCVGTSPGRWWIVALCSVLLAYGCTSGTSTGKVTIEVRPTSSSSDTAVHIHVRGLAPHALAAVTVESVDASGVPWDSSGDFHADRRGSINPDTTAPVSGSYTGLTGMGLVSSMTPQSGVGSAYIWDRSRTFHVHVHVGDTEQAASTFQRGLARPVTEKLTLERDGFIATYYRPATTKGDHTAILLIGGSNGGEPGPLLPALL